MLTNNKSYKKNINNKPKKFASVAKHYLVKTQDLPLSCPMPDMEAWSSHPKVYLPIKESNEVVCPYCSAKYILKDDTK